MRSLSETTAYRSHEVRLTPSEQAQQRRAVEIRSASYEEASNSVDVVWTTGATVRRYSWRDDVHYDEVLVVDASAIRLDRLNGGAPFLDTHDDYQLSSVIGSVVPGSAKIVGGKGLARVALSVAPEHAGIVANIKAGVIRNISVGYKIHRIEKVETAGNDVAVWRIVDWEPLEISAVAVPADAGSTIRGHGSNALASEQAQRRIAQASFDAIAAERARSNEIAELATRAGIPAIGTEHILLGTSVSEFKETVLKQPASQAQATRGFGVTNPREREARRAAAITNALLHRSSPATVSLTDDARDFRGMALLEIGRDMLEANGIDTRGMNKDELAGHALNVRSGGIGATSDFGSILSNIANVTLRAAYEAAPQTFRPLVREASAINFKPITRAALGEAPALNKIGENGEFKRGTLGEGKEIYRLATYGRIVAITRQVLINDDVDAFTRLPAAFGVQAAQLESDLVWGEILANPLMGDGKTLFHADHANIMIPGFLSLSTVAAGRAMFGKQTGLDGRTILGLSPSYLIVPTSRQFAGEQLLGMMYPAKVDDVVPDKIKRLELIVEPRLQNGIDRPEDGIVAPGSDAAWYMAGAPGQADVVEIAYLDGNRGVYTETRTGFGVDGVEIKARIDVAAKAMDHRNIIRNTGG